MTKYILIILMLVSVAAPAVAGSIYGDGGASILRDLAEADRMKAETERIQLETKIRKQQLQQQQAQGSLDTQVNSQYRLRACTERKVCIQLPNGQLITINVNGQPLRY